VTGESEFGAMVEGYWQSKNEILGEKPVPVPLSLKELKTPTKTSVSIYLCIPPPPPPQIYQDIAGIWEKKKHARPLQPTPVGETTL